MEDEAEEPVPLLGAVGGTEEDRIIRENREIAEKERMNKLLLKQDEERKLKEERRQKAIQDLNTWKLYLHI